MQNYKNLETLAVQAGYNPKNGESRVAPIVQSTTYAYDNAQAMADLFDLKAAGHFYTRLSHPTAEVLENKMTALEGGIGAMATSSGQSTNTTSSDNNPLQCWRPYRKCWDCLWWNIKLVRA